MLRWARQRRNMAGEVQRCGEVEAFMEVSKEQPADLLERSAEGRYIGYVRREEPLCSPWWVGCNRSHGCVAFCALTGGALRSPLEFGVGTDTRSTYDGPMVRNLASRFYVRNLKEEFWSRKGARPRVGKESGSAVLVLYNSAWNKLLSDNPTPPPPSSVLDGKLSNLSPPRGRGPTLTLSAWVVV